jgi:hypothetical protein
MTSLLETNYLVFLVFTKDSKGIMIVILLVKFFIKFHKFTSKTIEKAAY